MDLRAYALGAVMFGALVFAWEFSSGLAAWAVFLIGAALAGWPWVTFLALWATFG